MIIDAYTPQNVGLLSGNRTWHLEIAMFFFLGGGG